MGGGGENSSRNLGVAVPKPSRPILTSAALLACACSNGGRLGTPDDADVDRRAEAFAAAVRHVTKDAGFTAVDPRPVRVRGSLSHSLFPGAGSYLEVDSSLVAARTERVRGLGFQPERLLPLRENCTGFLVPPQVKETRGCPKESQDHLVLGQLQQKDGRWQMPVIEFSYNPTGLAWTRYDVELELREGAWTVVGETRHQLVD